MATDNKNIPTWPESKDFKKSIRLEFSIYVSGIIILIMFITGFVISNQYVDTVTQNVVDKLLVQARSYSSSSGKLILSKAGPDALLLNNICKKLSEENKDLFWSGIADTNGYYLAHSDIKQVIAKTKMQNITGKKYELLLNTNERVDIFGDSILISVPIYENNIKLGQLQIASSTNQISSAKTKSINTVLAISIFMLLVGIPLTTLLLHKKLKPIKVITNNLQSMDYQDIHLDIPIKNKNELGYLAETLKVMGVKLNLAQKEQIEQERISREFEIAHEIQSKILPRSYPKSNTYDFAGTYVSAKEVGGDYYDFIEHDKNHLGFLIADVSGKSLPGMLVMLLTRDIVRNLAHSSIDPAEILSKTNEQLLPNIKQGMFVTMFYGVLNINNGSFEFASAGHNPLVRMNSKTGSTELIKTKGFPLGLMPDAQFSNRIEKGKLTLDADEWLIQYTDGINEAQDSSGQEYGMDRFVESLVKNKDLNPKELIKNTIQDHTSFVDDNEQFDDITLLAMKWQGKLVENKNNLSQVETHVS